MSYYVNPSQIASITVGGTDVTDNVIEWAVSDSSLFDAGLMTTVGSLVLARDSAVTTLVDYKRTNYPRGTEVVANITLLDGTVVRHPRGLLYVISTSYDPETVELEIEIGCRLALASLTDNVDELLPLVPLPLDPAQRDFSSISGSFAAAGKYLFQDNQGDLLQGSFFEGDRYGEMAPGVWVSVLGTTTNSVSPLQSNGAIPDRVNLSYQYPEAAISSDNTGKIDQTETSSEYFIQYPGVVYVRQNDGSLPGDISTEEPNDGYQNPCGNSPTPPDGNGKPGTCSEGYTTVSSVITVPATKQERSETHYGAIGAQTSYSYSEVRGPAIEINGQYFADAYAACRYTYATKCNPGGDCPLVGTENVLQSYTETFFNYGSDGELASKVTDTYKNVLSAAREFNWRSGTVNGAPKGFTPLKYTDMFLATRTEERYEKENGRNIQTIVSYTSNAESGSGLGITEAEFEGAVVALSAPVRAPAINGSFSNLATSTDGAGSGMVLDVVSGGAGRVTDTDFGEIVSTVDGTYTLRGTNVPVYGGSGSGMRITYDVTRVEGGADTKDWTVTSEGSGYQAEDVVWNQQPGLGLGFGEFSLIVKTISPAQVSGTIKEPGTGYAAGDQVWVTSDTLVQAGASGAAGQGNLVFEIEGVSDNSGAAVDAPGIASLQAKTPIPSLINGVYRGLTLESISSNGINATADVYVLEAGGALDGIMTRKPDNRFGQAANIGWPTSLPAEGGSGTGATLSFRYNDSGPLNAAILDGFNFLGIERPGSGYIAGDVLVVKAADIAKLFAWIDPEGDDLKVEVTETSGRSVEVYPVNAGVGYDTSDTLAVPIEALYDKGATYEPSQKDLKLSVTSVVNGSGQSLLSINALAGQVTTSRTQSVTITTLPLSPDSLNSPTTDTAEDQTEIRLRNNKFLAAPPEAGLYIEEASAPVPFLLESQQAIQAAVEEYGIYLKNFILGDALGLQIVENLTDEIATGWYPGASFRYADPFSGDILALRADACTWGISPEEAGVSVNGIFLGKSRGTLVIPDNLVGNILPVPGSDDETPAPAPDPSPLPPVIDGEDGIDQGDYSMTVEVLIGSSVEIEFDENDTSSKPFSPLTLTPHVTTTVYLDGSVVTAGSTLFTTSSGGLPYSYKGSLLTQDAVTVVADLFQ